MGRRTAHEIEIEKQEIKQGFKTCLTCGKKFSLDFYSKNKRVSTGILASCKKCDRERKLKRNQTPEYKERAREREAKRRQTPERKEYMKNYNKRWRLNPENREKERQNKLKRKHIRIHQGRDHRARKLGFKDYEEFIKDRQLKKAERILVKEKKWENKLYAISKKNQRQADVIFNKFRYSEMLKVKRKEDLNYRLKDNLRARTRKALRCQSAKKTTTMAKLFGMCGKDLYNYLKEKGYDPTVCHVDHYIPLSKFDLTIPEHQQVAFYYENLQPLSFFDNISKANNLPEDWKEKVKHICNVRGIESNSIIKYIEQG